MKATLGSAVLLAAAFTAPTHAQITTVDTDEYPAVASSVLQVRAKEVVLADGSRIENGVLHVENGKIRRVGKLELDDSKPWIDHDGVLTAGFVACQSLAGMGGEAHDSTRSVLPEARLHYAFTPGHSDFEKALQVGITSVVLTPTEGNLAGGLTAVVKTDGETVVSKEAHLALSFSGSALQGSASTFRIFFSADGETAAKDGGPEGESSGRAGSRVPTSYSGAVRVLDSHMVDEQGAFARVAKGELPVLFAAWDRNQVARVARFATKHGISGAVRGAPLAGDEGLLPLIRESGLSVVLGPFAVGHTTRSLQSVKALQDAGVPVGFALDGPTRSPANFRMTGALAIAAGADAKEVLRSMTVVGAEIAGVGRRIGSIEAGKDADFVLWSGDPLDLSSSVEAVYVNGDLAWSNE